MQLLQLSQIPNHFPHFLTNKKKKKKERERNTLLTVFDDIVKRRMTFILESIHNEDQPHGIPLSLRVTITNITKLINIK